MKKLYLLFTKTALFLFLIFIAGIPRLRAQTVDTFNSPGGATWTAPAGVTSVMIEVWGGGGGGGVGLGGGTKLGGGGGGGGGYIRSLNVPVTPGSSYSITVGNGGTGPSTAGTPGTSGGNSVVTIGSITITATGGSGGSKNGGAASTGGTGVTTFTGTSLIYKGGAGSANIGTDGGGGGAGAGTSNDGASTTTVAGAGAANEGGAGGTGGAFKVNSIAGSSVGGGGGGGYQDGTSGAGAAGQIRITYYLAQKITSFTPTSGCPGTSFTITGTNFTNVSSVTVNGVAATFTVNSATQITATVPNGAATGKIAVTNPGSTVTSTTDFNVNVAPTIVLSSSVGTNTQNVCLNSPIENRTYDLGGSATSASVTGLPTGLTGTLAGSKLTVSGTPTVSGTFNYTVTTSGGSCSNAVSTGTITVNAGLPVITSAPSNASISAGGNASFTVTASNTPVSYSWQVSMDNGSSWTTLSNASVYSGASTATLNITSAPISMNGYLYRAVATNACGTSAFSATALLTVGVAYCTPTGNLNCTASDYISNVRLNSLDNSSACGTGGYTNYPKVAGQTTSVVKGFTYALTIKVGPGTGTHGAGVWIDFNQNGSFSDTGEFFLISNVIGPNGTASVNITIPAGAPTGDVRMRIRYAYNISVQGGVGMSCTLAGTYGETEDYTLTVADPAACTTPSSQPTSLTFVTSSTTITGNFAASAPAATNYLVLRSTSATPPVAPTNGSTYAIGSTYSAGYTVVDNDANTSFSATGLTNSTTYYFYIYALNGYCTGGPFYNGTAPLTGNATTSLFSYCIPKTTANTEYIAGIASVGTLGDNSNTSTYSLNGFGDYTATILATQIPGNGINFNIQFSPVPAESQFIKVWVDWNKDGTFSDTTEMVYTTGNTATGDTSFGFIIPSSQAVGDYRIRFRTRNFGGASSGNSTFDACTNYDRGETEDYTISVVADCAAKITSVTPAAACGPSNTVTLSAATAASTVRWYDAPVGGNLVASNSGSWTTGTLSATTTYYVAAWNGSCESKYRVPVVATIYPSSNITISASVPEVCGQNVQIQLNAAGDDVKETLWSQDFENGLAGWTVNSTNINGGVDTPWSIQTSPYQPTTTTVWKPAVNSGAVGSLGNHFIFSTSDYKDSNVVTVITSPLKDVSAYNSLTLSFDHYYSEYSGDKGELQVATDAAGTNWTTVQTYNTDLGSASKFTTVTADLTPYKSSTSLRIRFVYTAQWDDGWAIDNIKLEGIKLLPASFTWTGDTSSIFANCSSTTPGSGSASGVCVKPPANEYETKNFWTVTANAVLSTGCTVSKTVTIPNNNKFWTSAASSTNWADPKWAPDTALPTIDKCVIIKSPVEVPVNGMGLAKSIIVESTGKLTVHGNGSLKIQDGLTNNAGSAAVLIESDGGIVQVNEGNTINTGNITAQRALTLSAERQQYSYMASPVEGQNLKSPPVYPGITYVLYHNEANNYFYSSSGAYIKGRGLAIKEPTVAGVAGATATANFTGYPTNGAFTYPLVNSAPLAILPPNIRGYNLVANPYPSNIDLNLLYVANLGNAGTLSPTFYFWDSTVNDIYVQQGSNYGGQSYGIFNAVAPPGIGSGVAATGDISLASLKVPTSIVKMGQAFMVRSTVASMALQFNNTIRTTGTNGKSYFGKNIPEKTVDRYWLRLVSPTGIAASCAVVYFPEGDNGFARDDSFSMGGSDVIYSKVGDQKVSINGRSSFTKTDVIPLGTSHFASGKYTIGIQAAEGIFESAQPVYLKDMQTGVITNLSEGSYTFDAKAGESTGRFEIFYRRTNNTLLATAGAQTEELTVFRDGGDFTVKALHRKITGLEVYDAAGRLLYQNKPNALQTTLASQQLTSGVYILKIRQDESVTVKKILK